MKKDERRIIIDRADRLLNQSRTLRKLSDELIQESDDLRSTAKDSKPDKPTGGPPKKSTRRRR